MQLTERVIEEMQALQSDIERAYSEELCGRVASKTRASLVRELERTIGALQRLRVRVGGGISFSER